MLAFFKNLKSNSASFAGVCPPACLLLMPTLLDRILKPSKTSRTLWSVWRIVDASDSLVKRLVSALRRRFRRRMRSKTQFRETVSQRNSSNARTESGCTTPNSKLPKLDPVAEPRSSNLQRHSTSSASVERKMETTSFQQKKTNRTDCASSVKLTCIVFQ